MVSCDLDATEPKATQSEMHFNTTKEVDYEK